jgi:hypothetical protein
VTTRRDVIEEDPQEPSIAAVASLRTGGDAAVSLPPVDGDRCRGWREEGGAGAEAQI